MTLVAALRTKAHDLRSRSARIRAGDLSFAALALIVVFGSLLGIVVLQTFIVQNRVRLDDITQQLEIAQEENQSLHLLEIELEAPERILDAAVERLGMVRPTQRRYLPGVDPSIDEIRLPPSGNPFGPGTLPPHLRRQSDPDAGGDT